MWNIDVFENESFKYIRLVPAMEGVLHVVYRCTILPVFYMFLCVPCFTALVFLSFIHAFGVYIYSALLLISIVCFLFLIFYFVFSI